MLVYAAVAGAGDKGQGFNELGKGAGGFRSILIRGNRHRADVVVLQELPDDIQVLGGGLAVIETAQQFFSQTDVQFCGQFLKQYSLLLLLLLGFHICAYYLLLLRMMLIREAMPTVMPTHKLSRRSHSSSSLRPLTTVAPKLAVPPRTALLIMLVVVSSGCGVIKDNVV